MWVFSFLKIFVCNESLIQTLLVHTFCTPPSTIQQQKPSYVEWIKYLQQNIYLFKFSSINCGIKGEICSKFTIEVPNVILVSLLLTVILCSLIFLLILNILIANGILYCLDLNQCISESDLGTLSHLRRSSM